MDSAGMGAPIGELSAAAALVVSRLLGHSVLSSELVRRGLMTFKCHVTTAQGEAYMVRFYPAGRSSVVRQEPDLLARCRAAGLPVPQVIGDSRQGPPAPLSYVVYRRIEGETLADRLATLGDHQHRKLATELAGLLQRLRDITFDGAGELISATAASDASWRGFVERSMRHGLQAIEHHALLAPDLATALRQTLASGPPVPLRETTCLVWGDINFQNILINPSGTIAGLIDFEGCLSGDPVATWGYAQAVHGTQPFFGLMMGAAQQAGLAQEIELVAWYALLRAMRLANYAHLALPTGRARDPFIQIVPGIVPALSVLESQRRVHGQRRS